MAKDIVLGIRIKADGSAEVTRKLSDVRKELNNAGGAASGANRQFAAMASQVQSMARVLAGLAAIKVLKSIADEQEKLQRQLLRTEAIIKSTGAAAGFSVGQLHEQAREAAFATLQSTEGIMKAQQIMLTFKSVQGETFTRAMELANDLSVTIGGDLNSAVTQLGKALQDPVKGINAMARAGVSFSDQARELIKHFVETNQLAKAQKVILDELAGQYGGIAQNEAAGLSGALDTLGQRVEELKINLGNNSGIMQIWTGWVNDMAEAVRILDERLNGINSGIVDASVNKISNRVVDLKDEIKRLSNLSGRNANSALLADKERELNALLASRAELLVVLNSERAKHNAQITLSTQATDEQGNSVAVLNGAQQQNVSLIKSLRSPIEKFLDDTRKLANLYNAGKISLDAFNHNLAVYHDRIKEINRESDKQEKQWQQLIDDANALDELKDNAAQTQYLAGLAEQLKFQGLTNDEISQRIRLEQELDRVIAANPDLNEADVRAYVAQREAAEQRIEAVTAASAQKSAAIMDTAFTRAIENIQDSLASMFENVLTGSALDSFKDFADNIKNILFKAISQDLALNLQNLFSGRGVTATFGASVMGFGASLITSLFSQSEPSKSVAPASSYRQEYGSGAMHIAEAVARDVAFEYQSQAAYEFNRNLDRLSDALFNAKDLIWNSLSTWADKLVSLPVINQVVSFFRPLTEIVSQGAGYLTSIYNGLTGLVSNATTAFNSAVGLTSATVDAISTAAPGTGTAAAAAAESSAASTAANAATSAASTVAIALQVVKLGYDLYSIWSNDSLKTSQQISNSLYAIGDTLAATAIIPVVGWIAAAVGGALSQIGSIVDVLSSGFNMRNVSRMLGGGIVGDMLAGLFTPKPAAYVNTWNPMGDGANPSAYRYNGNSFANQPKSSFAQIGQETPFGLLQFSFHNVNATAQDMTDAFGQLIAVVEAVDVKLYNSINRLDAKFGQTGQTMDYFNNTLTGQTGDRWYSQKQKPNGFEVGRGLEGRYTFITDMLAESGTVVGQAINAWFDVLNQKFKDDAKDNTVFILGLAEQLADNIDAFLQFPLNIIELIGKSVKSVGKGGTSESVFNEINSVLNAYTLARDGLNALGVAVDNERVGAYLANVNAIGYGVQDAAVNLIAYGIALKKTNDDLTGIGAELLNTVESKLAELKKGGLSNTQATAYFGSFGLFADLFAEAGVAFSRGDLDKAANSIHDLTMASTQAAKDVIDHAIADEQLANMSRDAAIETLIRKGVIEQATAAESEYGFSIQTTTKTVLEHMGFIQQLGSITGQTLGEMGVSASTWQAAAANVVTVFGDMEKAMQTLDGLAQTFLTDAEYARYNLNTIDNAIATMQRANPALAALSETTIAAALKTGESMSAFIAAMAQGDGALAKEALTYVQLVGQRISAEQQLNSVLDALTAQRHELELKLMEAQGNAIGALTQRRHDELNAMEPMLAAIQAQINAENDLMALRNRAAAAAQKQRELDIALLNAQGKTEAATALSRQDAIDALMQQMRGEIEALGVAQLSGTNADILSKQQYYADIDARPIAAELVDAINGYISANGLTSVREIYDAAKQFGIDVFDVGKALGASAEATAVALSRGGIPEFQMGSAFDSGLAQEAQAIKGRYDKLIDTQKAIWAAEDLAAAEADLTDAQDEAAKAAQDAADQLRAIADERKGIQDQIDELTLSYIEKLDKQRNALYESNRALFDQLHLLQVAAQQHSLDIQLMEAQGNAAGALAARRQDELDAMDASLHYTQKAIWAAQDAAKAEDELAAARNDALNQAKNSVSSAMAALQDAVAREKERISADYDAQIKTAQASIDALSESVDKLKSLSDSLKSTLDNLRPLNQEAITRQAAQAQISAALAIAQAGGPLPDNLDRALSIVSEPSAELFASFTDYQRDFVKTAVDITALNDLTERQYSKQVSQLDIAQSQLNVLQQTRDAEMARLDGILTSAQNQIDAINGTTTAVLSIKDALAGLGSALSAQASAQAAVASVSTQSPETTPIAPGDMITASGLTLTQWQHQASIYGQSTDYTGPLTYPGFASGGFHDGGWRIVGESGPELEYTPPSRIYSNQDSKALIDVQALIDEVRQLRAELRAGQASIASASNKTAKVLNKWDYDGLPETTTA